MLLSLRKNTIAFCVLAATACLPLSAQAHRTWLLPSATQVEVKEPWVTLDAAVSENLFDFDTNPVKLEGLSIIGPDGAPFSAENLFTGRLRSSFDLKLSKPGTYKASIVMEGVFANYKQGGENKRWRGSNEAFAKEVPADAEDLRVTRTHNRLQTFLSSDKPNELALKPSGVGLEVEPITHPNELAVGSKASFRLLLDGKPVPNLGVSAVPGGVRYRGVLKEMFTKTDEKGVFSMTWPEAGMYWISANYPAKGAGMATANPPSKNERRFAYALTLEVLPH